MITYTIYDYFKLKEILRPQNYFLSEETEIYRFESKNNHHKHDKLFRNILNNKKEIVKLVNKYIMPEKKIEEEKIEKYDTKYITKEFKEIEADIVYKIKNKEIYFLIEHQTKLDKLMAYRMLSYSLEIIRTRMRNIIGKIEKVGIPTIIPIVIYTGQEKWTAKKTIEELQVKFKHLKGMDVITGYNLIDIRNEEEAIRQGTAIARMSVIERKQNTEEIITVIEKMSKYIKEKEERKEFANEVKYLLENRLTNEETEKIKEILIGKEGDEGMLHAQMVLKRDAERIKKQAIEEGLKEGIKKGIKEGRTEGKIEGTIEGSMKKAITIAKNMLKENFDIELISKITGLKKEQFIK